jgi:hypothetical protein
MPKLVDRPADPAIPTLAVVLEPGELCRRLSDLSWLDTSQGVQLRVLRWKRASRCTFELSLPTAQGGRELIGKVYADDRSDVYRNMEAIRRVGFGDEAAFGIPRPLAFVTSLRLLLYEKAPGARARNVIVQSDESDRAQAAERCGQWLARFHARGPRLCPGTRPHDQMKALEGACRNVVETAPALANKARRLFEGLAIACPRLAEDNLRAAHGTYTPGQVLLAEERTVTMDWDTYQVADPVNDVGRFLVELKRMGLKYTGTTSAFDATAAVFLSAYESAAGSDVRTRLAFHTAAICLDRAKHDVDKQAEPWAQRAVAMLDEGLRALELHS